MLRNRALFFTFIQDQNKSITTVSLEKFDDLDVNVLGRSLKEVKWENQFSARTKT